MDKVREEPNTGCWLWVGYIDDSGYGVFRMDNKIRGAHRVSWNLWRGNIPPGLFVCHHCDVRFCVNPDHLFLGTAAENQADMKRKGRSVFGSNSSRSKLTEADVLEIKLLLREGKLKKREIGRLFGISTSNIWHIHRGENWKRCKLPVDSSVSHSLPSQQSHQPIKKKEFTMSAFQPAFDFVMNHEDPQRSGKVTEDAGGRTRFGIAQKFHPELKPEFFSAPVEDALKQAEEILRRDYWDRMRLSEIGNQNVANKLFDMAVNMGVHQAGNYAQRVANGLNHQNLVAQALLPVRRLVEDGILGDKSLVAINSFDPIAYYQLLCDLSRQHYIHVASINPAQSANLHGWLKRAAA